MHRMPCLARPELGHRPVHVHEGAVQLKGYEKPNINQLLKGRFELALETGRLLVAAARVGL